MNCDHGNQRTIKDFGFGRAIRWCPDCGALLDSLSNPDAGWQHLNPKETPADAMAPE